MPITYRIWAKRHAAHLNEWLSAFKPHGLSGAVANTSCPDVLWEIFGLLADAQLGHNPSAFVLSMDLAKCFDRLDIGTFRDICQKLGLSSCLTALSNYESLTRLLFVDNEPSDVWLEGKTSLGFRMGAR